MVFTDIQIASFEQHKINLCEKGKYSKTCLKPLKKNKTNVLKTNGSLMEVESITECSLGAFCNTFDLHLAIIGLKTNFGLLFEWLLKTGFTVTKKKAEVKLWCLHSVLHPILIYQHAKFVQWATIGPIAKRHYGGPILASFYLDVYWDVSSYIRDKHQRSRLAFDLQARLLILDCHKYIWARI